MTHNERRIGSLAGKCLLLLVTLAGSFALGVVSGTRHPNLASSAWWAGWGRSLAPPRVEQGNPTPPTEPEDERDELLRTLAGRIRGLRLQAAEARQAAREAQVALHLLHDQGVGEEALAFREQQAQRDRHRATLARVEEGLCELLQLQLQVLGEAEAKTRGPAVLPADLQVRVKEYLYRERLRRDLQAVTGPE